MLSFAEFVEQEEGTATFAALYGWEFRDGKNIHPIAMIIHKWLPRAVPTATRFSDAMGSQPASFVDRLMVGENAPPPLGDNRGVAQMESSKILVRHLREPLGSRLNRPVLVTLKLCST